MRVLCIGECMAEMVPTGVSQDYRLGFAGDTFNTAWYLARSAPLVHVSYLTIVGDDAISAQMTKFTRDSGIDDGLIRTSPDKTIGLYMISLDKGERSFSYWRSESAARALADDVDHLRTAMADSDVIYFSGITLAILPDDGRSTLINAVKEARAAGKKIAFDPNLRPRLWASMDAMRQSIMEGAAVCDIALPSYEDEAHWFDDPTPQATARRYMDAGADTVIVKNGSGAVIVVEDGTLSESPVHPVTDLVDTTAAGDSFNAGFLAGYANGATTQISVAFACNLARAVVQQRGALVPIEVDELTLDEKT